MPDCMVQAGNAADVQGTAACEARCVCMVLLFYGINTYSDSLRSCTDTRGKQESLSFRLHKNPGNALHAGS